MLLLSHLRRGLTPAPTSFEGNALFPVEQVSWVIFPLDADEAVNVISIVIFQIVLP
jgi:hypothetical protein